MTYDMHNYSTVLDNYEACNAMQAAVSWKSGSCSMKVAGWMRLMYSSGMDVLSIAVESLSLSGSLVSRAPGNRYT